MRGLRAGALALWLVFVVLTLLGYAMQAELNRDESMYLSAAVCSRDLALYDGFPFPQMPGYPWFTGIFLAGWQSQPLLLIGRLLTATVALSCLLILVLLARRIGAGTWTGIALSTVLLLQPAFLEVAGQASNHLHPLLALAGAILILASDRGRVPAWAFVAGIVAGAAVLFRLTWFVVVAAMALGEFLRSPAGKRNRAVSFGAGVFVALLPAGLAALRAPDAFRFQNFGYHLVNRAWAVDVAGFHTGRDAFWNWMGRWGQSQVGHALLLALLAALLLAVRGRRDWKRKEALA